MAMPILILVAIVALIFGAIELGFIPPFHAMTLVRMRNGSVIVEKGNLRGNAPEHVQAILRDAGIRNGFVAVTNARRVYFSRRIPADARQPLRNVLLN